MISDWKQIKRKDLKGAYRRIGDSIEMNVISKTPGPWRFSLPRGFEIDWTKLDSCAKTPPVAESSTWELTIDETRDPRLVRKRRLAKFFGIEDLLRPAHRTEVVTVVGAKHPPYDQTVVGTRHMYSTYMMKTPVVRSKKK